METVSDGCPTGILIDVGLQTNVLNIKKGNKNQIPDKNNKEKNIVDECNSSNLCSSNCLLDQSPPNTPSILKTNVFFTPKSKWKTPSPKSMKIISLDASRIIDQLYSSPINCSEVMIYDEVFPVEKSLDDACFDEFHINSENLHAIDINVTHEKIDQDNSNSFDLTNCKFSSAGSCSSENIVRNEKLSTMVRQFDMKPAKENYSIPEKSVILENSSIQKSCAESVTSNKKNVKSVTCYVNPVSADSYCMNKLPLPEQEVTTPKKLPTIVKGFGIKKSPKKFSEKNKENEIQSKSPKKFSEKNKENEIQSNGQAKYGSKFSKVEKSYNNNEKGTKKTETKKDRFSTDESMVDQSSMKCVPAKYSILENKKAKDNKNLKDNLSKNLGKPKALQQKSNIGRSQSLLYKKDPLYKTETLLGTPIVEPSVRRFHSFHYGSSKKTIPTVEGKSITTTRPNSNVLKPKMFMNQVSSNGNGFSTPLQFRRNSTNFKLADSFSANPIGRKSLAFNSNHSFLASGVKDTAKKDQCSTTKKSAVSSNRLGFGKKLGMQSSHPKLKNDSLPRKLFP